MQNRYGSSKLIGRQIDEKLMKILSALSFADQLVSCWKYLSGASLLPETVAYTEGRYAVYRSR